MTSTSDQHTPKRGIPRRTVVAGTAWSVPAIIVASAAPAMAASGPVILTGRACMGGEANDLDYYLEVLLSNTGSGTANQFCFTQIVLLGVTIPLNPQQCYILGAGTEQTVTLTINDQTVSGTGSATLSYTIAGAPGVTSATYTSFPSLDSPACYQNN